MKDIAARETRDESLVWPAWSWSTRSSPPAAPLATASNLKKSSLWSASADSSPRASPCTPWPATPRRALSKPPPECSTPSACKMWASKSSSQRKLPPLARYPRCKVIVNVFGYTVAEYIAVIERLNQAEGIAAYELNVSCPNVHAGGMAFGADPGRSNTSSAGPRPLHPPADRQALAQRDLHRPNGQDRRRRRRRRAQPDQHLPRHVHRRRDPPAAPVAISPAASPDRPSSPSPCAWSTKPPAPSPSPSSAWAASQPSEDAVEFLLAGATAVQVGTASYADPRAAERLAQASSPGAAATAYQRSPTSPEPWRFRGTEPAMLI